MKEAPVQQRVRLKAAYSGVELWRNNSGACYDKTGRLIRYGLGNDSAELNKKFKSSDLIGITPVTAYLQSTGWTTLGVFTALECKPSGWKLLPSDERGAAQAAFHDIVRKAGGFAGFINDAEMLEQIVRRS